MSPVDRAGPLTGKNFALGSYEKLQPGFRDEKRPKILETSFGAKLEKQNKDGETQLSYYFAPIMASGNRDEVFIWQNFPASLPRSWLEKPRSR